MQTFIPYISVLVKKRNLAFANRSRVSCANKVTTVNSNKCGGFTDATSKPPPQA